MANNITAIVPKILASGLMTLRETCVMPQLVNGNYSKEAKEFGATIDVPIPTKAAATDVAPSHLPSAPTSITPATVQIPLNKWKKSDFHLTDKEMKEMDARQSFLPMQIAEAARALANQVNADILSEYLAIYGWAGAAGTTPFSTDASAAIAARKVLAKQLCPPTSRRMVINADAEANALGLAAFADVDKAGDAGTKREGQIGRKYGFDWFMEDALPQHVAGTITTGLAAKSATVVAVGAKTFAGTTAASTGACNLKVGDVIEIAGHAQTYVLTAPAVQGTAATDVQLSVSPGLEKALAGGEAITVKASHVVNLAFHRDAFAFANRPMSDVEFKGGNILQTYTDALTGISLTLEVSRQTKQTVWEFSILYGTKLVRPELACRIGG